MNFFQGLGGHFSTVLESQEVIDGRKAIVCAGGTAPSFVVWLDPERNYAVLKKQSNGIQWVEKDGKYLVGGLVPEYVVEEKDFFDAGGGVWMPRHIITRWLNKDGPTAQEDTTNVESAEINGVVADSEFKDIFPTGMQVLNGISGAIYNAGELPDAPHGEQNILDELKSEARIEATGAAAAKAAEPTVESSGRRAVRTGATGQGRYRLLVVVIGFVCLAALAAVAVLRAKRGKP